jgi:hypothetical protein
MAAAPRLDVIVPRVVDAGLTVGPVVLAMTNPPAGGRRSVSTAPDYLGDSPG